MEIQRLARRVLWVATLLICAVAPVNAQSLAVGRFEGEVRARDSHPLADAEVRVAARQGGTVRWTTTGRDGRFRFDALPVGRYDITVELAGYRPVVHLDVLVGAGRTADLAATLAPATPPVVVVDTVPHRGDATALGQWLVDRGYSDLAGARRIGIDLANFSTMADATAIEGLPWRMSGTLIDGARAGNPAAPAGSGADAAGLAVPVRALATGTVGGLGYDVEVGGTGVGLVGSTRRGSRQVGASGLVEGGSAVLGASYQVSGPLQGDTAQAAAGFDFQRSTRDFWSPGWEADPREFERIGAFGRIDWQAGDRLSISARASGGQLTSRGYGETVGLGSFYGSDYAAIAAQGSVNVFARLSRRVSNEWRIAADVGRSEGNAGALLRGVDATNVARFGGALGTPHRELRTTPRITGLLHIDAGAHRLKLGVTGSASRIESDYVRDSDGIYVFGATPGATAPAAWRGVQGAESGAVFRLRESAFLVQDDWRVVDGLAVTLGLRMEQFDVPVERIEANGAWTAASGLLNTDVAPRRSAVSPRIGFRWELGRDAAWLLEGGAGTFRELPDVRDLAEAFTLDRSGSVRYGIGTLPTTVAPSLTEVPVVGQTLTMLAPDFGGSRTQRLSLGITRRTGEWSVSLNGVYRQTDGLSRRRDLNLSAFPAGRDQNGRMLFGTLQQLGSALVPTPQSNRRFQAFDAVHLLDGSGTSEFWGLTAGIERVRERGVSVVAFYTFSRTTDNLTSFGSTLAPVAAGWSEGRSDFDVPHRAMVGVEWRPNDRVSVGTIYRVRSGLPFTPGFRDGVDANGDGDWTNDVAFVDATLPGMSDVRAEQDCLRVGAFAARNSCRGDLVHGLDLRVAFRIAQLRVGRVDAVVDAVDLLTANAAPVDRALLLIDETATIATNPATGITTLPYRVNTAFGRQLPGRSPGVFWRVGLRVTP